MKFFLAIFTSFAVAFGAAETLNLRGGATKNGVATASAGKTRPTWKMVEASVQIGGLLHKPTADELATLNEIVTKSYNLSFEPEVRETISTPVDDNQATEVVVDMDELAGIATVSFRYRFDWYSGYCRLCLYDMDDWHSYYATYRKPRMDDDHAVLGGYAEDNIVQIHDKFEKRMCKNLKETGLANFAQASDCMFTFLDDEDETNVNEEERVTLLPVEADLVGLNSKNDVVEN